MATEKQIAANIANAQKCTGPRTEEGKARSSMNALKTGLDAKSEIIENYENRGERDELTAAYYARYNPATEEERYLLDTAISAEWLQRRYLSVEANLWKDKLGIHHSLGMAFDRASESFARLDRRLNSALRNHAKAMKQLHALRVQRGADPTGDIPLAGIAEPTTAAPSPDQPADPPPHDPGAEQQKPTPTQPPPLEEQPVSVATIEPPQHTDSSALNTELVSFRTFSDPAPQQIPASLPSLQCEAPGRDQI